jgi:acetyl-CoA C-acetyltransferase
MQISARHERVGIVSTAQTQLRSAWTDAQHIDLISSVVQRALKGSGLRLKDVDFVIDSGSDVLDGRSISNCGFLGAMGAHHKEESRVEDDGLWAALYGVTKIASGSADVGLIIAYSKPSESDVNKFYATLADPFYQRIVGLDENTSSGLMAQHYLKKYSLSEEILGEVAASAWLRASGNPFVELSEVPDLNQVMSSPMVSSPLRQLMIARPVDGAVAIILASERFAKRMSSKPVWVTGMGMSMDSNNFVMREHGLPACSKAANMAYARAGMSAENIELTELSATSAIGELLTMEALGLAAPGRGIDIIRDSQGTHINASGGALAANPIMATGLVRLAEATERIKETNAASALVHGSSGIGAQSHCVFVIEV